MGRHSDFAGGIIGTSLTGATKWRIMSVYVTSEIINPDLPVESCHASTIVELHEGGLAASWFGGTGEGNPDVAIWLQRFEFGQWSRSERVADGVVSASLRYPSWNPILFQPSRGPLLLFYKVGQYCSNWWGELKRSTDGGKTWSDAQRLPDGILGPIRNKPIELASGDILCPSSEESSGWTVHIERTVDLGETWSKTGPINDGRRPAAIQPSLLAHPDGRLQAVGRTRSGRVFSAFSSDQGMTWEEMTLLPLPNPNSATDAVALADGRFLLVYNHSSFTRSPLNVAVSNDGFDWTPVLTLESDDDEYSYPAVIQSRDGLVHITYTWRRRHIKHVVLDPGALTGAI